jgi:mRNA deadenylase 3'-5' endonuclease subunit Ccr4
MKEILRWMPHVVSLQEVDHFEDFFEPKMTKAGFVGVYKRRCAGQRYGALGCSV